MDERMNGGGCGGGGAGAIPATNAPRTVPCAKGGHLLVRAVRRSQLVAAMRLVEAGGGSLNDVGGFAKYKELAFRAGVVGCDGLTLEGKEVKAGVEKHPSLGSLCSIDVYDAVDVQDLEKAYAIASGTERDAAAGAEGDPSEADRASATGGLTAGQGKN